MAETRVPSVLWNVSQSLSKAEKGTARTNIGVNGIIHNSVAHEFVSAITEDSNGNLSVSGAVPTTADISGLDTALSTLQSKIDNHKHKVQFNSETAIDLTTNNSTAISLNHSHGAITTDGKITGNAVSIASGMSLLIANSSKEIKNSSLTFGTDSTKYLNNKGEWAQPFFHRFSYTTTTETYYSQLSVRETPSTNEGLYLDESRQGYLVPEMDTNWVKGQVLSLYRGDQVTINRPIRWGNPYLTAYNTVESNQYTPTLHAGLHLGDGFGWGLSNTIETPYNGNTFPTDTVLIMEGASITMSKIGMYNGGQSSTGALYEVWNKNKISSETYKDMLCGGDHTGHHQYNTSYVSTLGEAGNGQARICRVPPHHWVIASLHMQTHYQYSTTTTIPFACKLVDEDTSVDSSPDSDTCGMGYQVFNSSTISYHNFTTIAHNNSDKIKSLKLAIYELSGGTFGSTIYKQFVIFKMPEEDGAFNTPDVDVWPDD